MSDVKTYPVPADFAAQANVSAEQYQQMYKRSVDDPAGFWGEQAEQYLTWFKKWDTVLDWSFAGDDLHINWFTGGTLNVSYNCLDRHLETRGDQVAIIWEGDDPNEDRKITYRELHEEVCRFANVLKEPWRQERRSRLAVSADGRRSCRRHARLYAHRRRSLNRVRWLLPRRAERPYQRFRL